MVTYEIINIGALPNDGSGDPLRVAFGKINNNFANLSATGFATANVTTVSDSANQVIFETPVSGFTQGLFQIRSGDVNTADSQDIMLQAQINNAGTQVKFTGYGTSFFGNAITSYDMDISGPNVRVLVNPLSSITILHFISAQITYIGPDIPGSPIELDGYAANSIMNTENYLEMSTE
jgi:hypothetical protein